MKNRKIAVAAAVGTIVILTFCGTLAAKTVFAAEEVVVITDANSETALQADTEAEVLKVFKNEKYKDTGCTVKLPTGYIASDSIKGMFISERNPIDSSNIYYSVSDNVDAKALRTAMTTDDYKKRVETKFKEAYGADSSITSYEIENTEVDGCPAYKIKLSCSMDNMVMEQLIFVIAADKVYTITYSQSTDDEKMEDFEKSAKSIRMVYAKS